MRNLIQFKKCFIINKIGRRCISQFEPPYLNDSESEIPLYPKLNVQLKGYDFPILEKYSGWIHKIARHMGLDVTDCWATPCQKLHIKTYKIGTTNVLNTYDLQIYERNVQIADLEATIAPLLFEIIKAALPEGVELSIHEHFEEHTEFRYIPDLQLKELEKQLWEIGGPTKSN